MGSIGVKVGSMSQSLKDPMFSFVSSDLAHVYGVSNNCPRISTLPLPVIVSAFDPVMAGEITNTLSLI